MQTISVGKDTCRKSERHVQIVRECSSVRGVSVSTSKELVIGSLSSSLEECIQSAQGKESLSGF